MLKIGMSKQKEYLNKIAKHQVSSVKRQKPEIRFLDEMQPVLYDQKWFKNIKNPENFEVYYVYRGIKRKKGLRYDITVIFPKMLGREFPKTKGHQHKNNFPEFIQVLEGKAFYFFQKRNKNKIEDVYVIKARKGERLIVPPGYEHLAINPSKKKLVMANWIWEKCQNIYDTLEKKRGACYYYAKRGWVKNKNYKEIPKLHFEKPLKLKNILPR